MIVSKTAESTILKVTVPMAPIAGKSCLAIDAPPCTQIIASSVAGIAILIFDFFIYKFIIQKGLGGKSPGFNKLLLI